MEENMVYRYPDENGVLQVVDADTFWKSFDHELKNGRTVKPKATPKDEHWEARLKRELGHSETQEELADRKAKDATATIAKEVAKEVGKVLQPLQAAVVSRTAQSPSSAFADAKSLAEAFKNMKIPARNVTQERKAVRGYGPVVEIHRL
jgi:hypothetical protein